MSQYRVTSDEIPHPYSSIAEYNRAMQMPLGPEWNAAHVVNKLTAPEIKKRMGRIIEPIKQPTKKAPPKALVPTKPVATKRNSGGKQHKKQRQM